MVVSLLWDAVVSLTHGDNTNTHDSTAALVGARPLTQGLAAAGKELWRTLHSHMDSLLRMAVLVPDLPRKKSSVRVQPGRYPTRRAQEKCTPFETCVWYSVGAGPL